MRDLVIIGLVVAVAIVLIQNYGGLLLPQPGVAYARLGIVGQIADQIQTWISSALSTSPEPSP